MAAIIQLLHEYRLIGSSQVKTAKTELNNTGKTSLSSVGAVNKLSIQSSAYQLTYEQSLTMLKQQAEVAALENPPNLTILAGDSLSMWFPTELLPPERTWLNQGIAGNTSVGLLERLQLFDATQPEAIFIMIGINDIIRGETDKTILENQRQIIYYLQRVHPDAQIVLQSILPLSGEGLNWIGQDNQLNSRIRQLNQKSKAIADQAGIYYHDLYPLFADEQGNLRSELTTDGLHLSQEGYRVWRSALHIRD